MPLNLFYIQSVHKDKVEYELYLRYKTEIDSLRELGFNELHYYREVYFPFSVIPFFWIYPIYYLHGDRLGISFPLRVTGCLPVLFNYEYDSYATVTRLATSFSTRFVDNTILKTYDRNWNDQILPHKGFYAYGIHTKAIRTTRTAAAWQQHIEQLLTLERKGRETDSQLSIETYEAISGRSERITMGIE